MAVKSITLRPAIFLDKDGTLLVDVPFNVDAARIALAERAAEALQVLGQLGVPLVVVSNQAGVAHGRFTEEALDAVRQRLADLFEDCGAHLSGFYYCPHHPQGVNAYAIECSCRKPQPGMLRRAADDLGIALERSWMVGDILDDVEAGRRAGCNTILIDNGNETEWQLDNPLRRPHHMTRNIGEAARIIAENFAAHRHGSHGDKHPGMAAEAGHVALG